MEFGPVPLTCARGAILAHSHKVLGGRIRKGRILTDDDLGALAAAGLSEVVVARLGPDDLHEDEAATRLAAALVPDPDAAHLRVTEATTGRVNFYATGPGILEIDVAAIHALNRIDPMLTLATLPAFARAWPRRMVATVKVISYGVSAEAADRACAAALGALRVRPVVMKSAGLILTEMDEAPAPAKGETAIATRLDALGMELSDVSRVRHRQDAIAHALAALEGDLALILTASATSDASDLAPAAVRQAGGRVKRFGMPVDPGNLLFLGEVGERPVIGLPGCARSPALNGADWVLERVACGLEVSDEDIAAMGVGGLLKESPGRPHPRE
ncbi:molybdopterin-binding protein [Tranquillimonas alkanivorans]|uniref:Molybdenum cofactor cytidylyltransferase n=1 Tax=Tranquillimonas alkanivorans TaxID=441119 RepID=A0A1I5R639_9RHOB|nr:molybdopterin-binding protein [Tranquillimonas alkanivorans]SFP53840.1 molybdenum cofactor cytidylyltransferase [Tranquillimonas alkanivorans]